jgi:hypothetical protein
MAPKDSYFYCTARFTRSLIFCEEIASLYRILVVATTAF